MDEIAGGLAVAGMVGLATSDGGGGTGASAGWRSRLRIADSVRRRVKAIDDPRQEATPPPPHARTPPPSMAVESPAHSLQSLMCARSGPRVPRPQRCRVSGPARRQGGVPRAQRPSGPDAREHAGAGAGRGARASGAGQRRAAAPRRDPSELLARGGRWLPRPARPLLPDRRSRTGLTACPAESL